MSSVEGGGFIQAMSLVLVHDSVPWNGYDHVQGLAKVTVAPDIFVDNVGVRVGAYNVYKPAPKYATRIRYSNISLDKPDVAGRHPLKNVSSHHGLAGIIRIPEGAGIHDLPPGGDASRAEVTEFVTFCAQSSIFGHGRVRPGRNEKAEERRKKNHERDPITRGALVITPHSPAIETMCYVGPQKDNVVKSDLLKELLPDDEPAPHFRVVGSFEIADGVFTLNPSDSFPVETIGQEIIRLHEEYKAWVLKSNKALRANRVNSEAGKATPPQAPPQELRGRALRRHRKFRQS